MITSVFFPERIGSYYLLAKRVVGIQITDREVCATVLLLKGQTRTIEALLQEKLPSDPELSYDEQVIQALRSLKLKLGKFDEIICALPSSQVIFKELTLPFTGLKKIKMVVPFEAEPLLPFNLDEGTVDSIITGVDQQEQQTHVLVAAVKNSVIARYENFFASAELPLDKLSVDMFDLYGLYDSLHKEQVEKAVALITMGMTSTTIGLIFDGRLTYIRSLSKGLLPNKETKEDIIIDKDQKAYLSSVLDDVRITLDGARERHAQGALLSRVILTGPASTIHDTPGLAKLIKSTLDAPVEILDPKHLINTKVLTSKVATIPGTFMTSIATAIRPEKSREFTLLQEKAVADENRRINYQLLTIGILVLTMFLTFSLYSFLRVRTLKKAHKSYQSEAIRELQKHFTLKRDNARFLDRANKAAQKELKKQETAWRRISADNRYAYLKNLAGLTRCIDMKESQLNLDTIILKDDTIKLYGKVPGYQQLTKLQNQLECPFFQKVPKLQSFNFKSEPITLVVNPEAR